jgi:DNA invertase Pin-like site-specific DNA recombinase
VTDLQEREIGFKSLTESIDTTTSGGRLVFNIFASLAEFEREIIKERTNAGLLAARSRGRKGGRRTALTEKQLQIARQLYDAKTPVQEICETLGISRATFYRHMNVNQNQE